MALWALSLARCFTPAGFGAASKLPRAGSHLMPGGADVLSSIPELIFALMFVSAVGWVPSPVSLRSCRARWARSARSTPKPWNPCSRERWKPYRCGRQQAQNHQLCGPPPSCSAASQPDPALFEGNFAAEPSWGWWARVDRWSLLPGCALRLRTPCAIIISIVVLVTIIDRVSALSAPSSARNSLLETLDLSPSTCATSAAFPFPAALPAPACCSAATMSR